MKKKKKKRANKTSPPPPPPQSNRQTNKHTNTCYAQTEASRSTNTSQVMNSCKKYLTLPGRLRGFTCAREEREGKGEKKGGK